MSAYTEIVDFTFTANETSRTFSGLSITKDDFIKIVVTFKNGTGTGSGLFIFPNNQTTGTHYHTQQLVGGGGSVSAARFNSAEGVSTSGNDTAYGIYYGKLSENDRFNLFLNYTQQVGSLVDIVMRYTTSSGVTFANGITSLTFQSGVTNAIGTGSRIQIYKLAATKVRDIIVETNSTQVNIPTTGIFDPAIDKNSEYLLVSDVKNTTTNVGSFYLYINDNTTEADYHSQKIVGNGSTASASRANAPFYFQYQSGSREVVYTHIKLSNIGAYTYQSYGTRAGGTSGIQLQNFFGSSTAENITSISKINLVHPETNGIEAGSRFTLYKLYE